MLGAGGAVVAKSNAIDTACCRNAVGGSCSSALYFDSPPMYSLAMSLDSSRNSTFQLWVPCIEISRGGRSTHVSMKLRRTPLLHVRLLFLQLLQCGMPSSHFRCRSRHVRHPVRTLLGLFGPSPSFSPSPALIESCLLSALGPTLRALFLEVTPGPDPDPDGWRGCFRV